MDETILLPSPNWFLASNLAVSSDGWLVYGGPSKSLCVLEPRKADTGIITGNEKYQAHVVTRAHHERIVSVDISPEWLEKKTFLSGSSDGFVKQWVLEIVNSKIKIKATHSHDAHHQENEELVGVGYSNETIAITVGCFSNIVKWDLSSNVSKTYPNFIKNFRPTCMACSQHIPLNVAIGTKQGVVFVVDFHGSAKILYKVRGQDDEIMNVSWCPQYELIIKKKIKESENRSFLAKRLAAIRNEKEAEPNVLEQSGIGKNLPEDSFDESIVQEDDMFDIYKDHEPDEFGHKKYEPEDILVKVKQDQPDNSDFLDECLKLKQEILKRKDQTGSSIESLVDALDKTHVEVSQTCQSGTESTLSQTESAQASTSAVIISSKTDAKVSEESSHIHKHLLATVGKHGGVRIWSKSGKLVSSCAIPINPKNMSKKLSAGSPTILWYKPDLLVVADSKSQLLEINPLNIDCKNKLEYRIVHTLHKRGMYCIATNAPRLQTEITVPSNDWSIWTLSQDRKIIRYCLKRKRALSVHTTCGAFIYMVQPCPYDATKIAIGVGDGAVRVWESSTSELDDTKLIPGRVASFWQNVQGKVLTVAWHPTKEHLLAFSTAEARVGLIDTSGKSERPARTLLPVLNNAVYALCWGEAMHLYACGGGSLVLYRANLHDQAPEPIDVTLEGDSWKICAASWSKRGLLCGSYAGAIALLTPYTPHSEIASTYLFTKMIHALEWHPQQTSNSSEESQYKDLIAVCSLDKESTIAILEYGIKEDGSKQLSVWKTLSGHKLPALQLAWNPHCEELLLSSSQDSTVRVWDISSGRCISIFGHHSLSTLGVSWLALPARPHHVLSGGGDAALRLWDIHQHKAEDYDETKHEVILKKQPVKKYTEKKEKKAKGQPKTEPAATNDLQNQEQLQLATNLEITNNKVSRAPKKYLLPLMYKKVNDPNKLAAPKKMLQLYLQKIEANTVDKGNEIHNVTLVENVEKTDAVVNEMGDACSKDKKDSTTAVEEKGDSIENASSEIEENTEISSEDKKGTNTLVSEKRDANRSDTEIDVSFLKVFGTIKEVNEYLDLEMANHLESGHPDAWIMLSIFRGHIDTMIQFASQCDILCPFLLSMAPCVSFKYWKDATQLYLAQIDRLVARGAEEKLYENRPYGGPKYRKAAILLSMHDVMGAVAALSEGKLFKEAYILCRIRYMDSVAEEILNKWAADLNYSGLVTMSAVCYMALGNLSQAAQVLARSQDQEQLSLAADVAKIAGRTSFADHMEKKALTQSQAMTQKTEELLNELPSKIELLMKETNSQNSDNLQGDMFNGTTLKSDKLNGDTETVE